MAAGASPAPNESSPSREETATSADRPPAWWQAVLCGTLFAAILASRYLQFANGGVTGAFFTKAFLLQDAIAMFTALPVVYTKVRPERSQPLLVQLGLIFTAGMGWQHLIFSLPLH
jgi:hypothetical protein